MLSGSECVRAASLGVFEAGGVEDGSEDPQSATTDREERTTDVVLASWIDMKYLCVTGIGRTEVLGN